MTSQDQFEAWAAEHLPTLYLTKTDQGTYESTAAGNFFAAWSARDGEIERLKSSLRELSEINIARRNHLGNAKKAAGISHADDLVGTIKALRKDARRWQCVKNAIQMQSPYAVWREGSHVVLGNDADELVDNFLSQAKEVSHG